MTDNNIFSISFIIKDGKYIVIGLLGTDGDNEKYNDDMIMYENNSINFNNTNTDYSEFITTIKEIFSKIDTTTNTNANDGIIYNAYFVVNNGTIHIKRIINTKEKIQSDIPNNENKDITQSICNNNDNTIWKCDDINIIDADKTIATTIYKIISSKIGGNMNIVSKRHFNKNTKKKVLNKINNKTKKHKVKSPVSK